MLTAHGNVGDLFRINSEKYYTSFDKGHERVTTTTCSCAYLGINCTAKLIMYNDSTFLLLNSTQQVGYYFFQGHIFSSLHTYMKRIET